MPEQHREAEGPLPSGPIIALLGPTAVGKSRHALELCQEFGGVIVSADSRQVYRYMDVGTAKPSLADRSSVPHYLVDVVEPSETYSAQRFAAEAQRVLVAMGLQRRPAFVVGGTGFYVSVLLDRPSLPSVAPDPTLRSKLRHEAARVGSQAMHGRLQSADPVSASRIHPNNLPRVVRALEIIEVTGGPVPTQKSHLPVPALYLGLQMERSALYGVADRRVDEQIRAGLIDEVEMLLAMGYAPTLPTLDGLGYRQIIEYLQGDVTREVAIEQYKIATHQYIRRQLTWFRKDTRVEWFPATTSAGPALRDRVRRFLTTVSEPASATGDALLVET